MLDQDDVFRMAHLLIREHRQDAARQAVNRMYASRSGGDDDGERAWRRVLIVIAALQGVPAHLAAAEAGASSPS